MSAQSVQSVGSYGLIATGCKTTLLFLTILALSSISNLNKNYIDSVTDCNKNSQNIFASALFRLFL